MGEKCNMVTAIIVNEKGMHIGERECGNPASWRFCDTLCCESCIDKMREEDPELCEDYEPVEERSDG